MSQILLKLMASRNVLACVTKTKSNLILLKILAKPDAKMSKVTG